MQKQEAIDLFGGVKKMADALSLTRQAVYLWDDDLTVSQQERVQGAYLRINAERQEAAKQYFGWLK